MQIFVDADACPKVIREVICKAVHRCEIPCLFVNNNSIDLPKSKFIRHRQVSQGFDVADDAIVEMCAQNDIVITNDIPLAHDAIQKNAHVLTFHGKSYTKENIKQALSMRDFMDTMRGTGVLDQSQMGGQKPFSSNDKKQFADALNRLIQA